MPDNEDSSTETTKRSWRRQIRPRASEVPREVVLGMDEIERKVSFAAGGIALILAVFLVPHLLHNTYVIDTAKLNVLHKCQSGYHLVSGACQRTRLTHPSAWIPQFAEIIIFGAALVLFAKRAKRSGVAVCALFLGLALGTIGLPFLFLGGWLIIRAFRLQKYGDATFSGANRRAREKAKAKREGRVIDSKGTTRSGTRRSSKSPIKMTGPAPSKRYTPKQNPRKR